MAPADRPIDAQQAQGGGEEDTHPRIDDHSAPPPHRKSRSSYMEKVLPYISLVGFVISIVSAGIAWRSSSASWSSAHSAERSADNSDAALSISNKNLDLARDGLRIATQSLDNSNKNLSLAASSLKISETNLKAAYEPRLDIEIVSEFPLDKNPMSMMNTYDIPVNITNFGSSSASIESYCVGAVFSSVPKYTCKMQERMYGAEIYTKSPYSTILKTRNMVIDGFSKVRPYMNSGMPTEIFGYVSYKSINNDKYTKEFCYSVSVAWPNVKVGPRCKTHNKTVEGFTNADEEEGSWGD